MYQKQRDDVKGIKVRRIFGRVLPGTSVCVVAGFGFVVVVTYRNRFL